MRCSIDRATTSIIKAKNQFGIAYYIKNIFYLRVIPPQQKQHQSIMAPASRDPMVARLATIENKLGIVHGKPRVQPDENNAERRLSELKALFEATTDPAFRESCAESRKLMKDLDAGTALTHQTSSSTTPLYYRRAEVLSSSADLRRDMDQISQMLNLLLIDQEPRKEGQTSLREEEITQAPIVNIVPPSNEDERRLDILQANIGDMEKQAKNLCHRVDALLKCYTALIATCSQKMVLADEEVSAREQKK